MQNHHQNQQGAALAISLIVLLLLTLIGVAAVQGNLVEERMSYNMKDSVQSFQATEMGLKEGEDWLLTLTAQPDVVTTCASQPCVYNINSSLYLEDQTSSWWGTNANAYPSLIAGVTSLPRYYVEFERFVPDSLNIGETSSSGRFYYRVTSRGTGAQDDSVSVIQSTVMKRF